MRPVTRGWLRYESLLDGTADLCDIAFLNEAADVDDENVRRRNAAVSKGR